MRTQLSRGTERGPGDVTGRELGFGSDIEHHHLATAQAGGELVAVDELDAVTLAEICGGQPVKTSHSLSDDSS